MEPMIRYPAVAESFYPSDPAELETCVADLLKNAPSDDLEDKRIKAIMVPHAGYDFSGLVAAAAYGTLRHRSFQTVLMMGDAHAYRFGGIALDGHETWESPLGRVPVNTDLAEKLRESCPEFIMYSNTAHYSDHILEVQLPFLQLSLKPGFTLLPMLFGENPPDIYHTAFKLLRDVLGPDDLVIASTDLSHYPSWNDACTVDRKTIRFIVQKDIQGLEKHVKETLQQGIAHEVTLFCGPDCIKTLLQLADHFGWQAKELSYANSGDTPLADKEAVVGYGAVAFYESYGNPPSLYDPVNTSGLSPDIS